MQVLHILLTTYNADKSETSAFYVDRKMPACVSNTDIETACLNAVKEGASIPYCHIPLQTRVPSSG